MGKDDVQAAEESFANNAKVHLPSPRYFIEREKLIMALLQVHPRQPRNHSKSSMFGLWEDYDWCFTRGNLGDGGKVEVDYRAWGEGVEAGTKTKEFSHDVQAQWSAVGAIGSFGGMCKLEVRTTILLSRSGFVWLTKCSYPVIPIFLVL